MNRFKAKGELSSGVVEGFNNMTKLAIGKSHGFRTFTGMEMALYHPMGDLPGSQATHRFFEEPIIKWMDTQAPPVTD